MPGRAKENKKMAKQKHTLIGYDFLGDEDFQIYLSEQLMTEYGRISGISPKQWYKTFEKCARKHLEKLNRPRTTSDLLK